jgi:hypothetical protein
MGFNSRNNHKIEYQQRKRKSDTRTPVSRDTAQPEEDLTYFTSSKYKNIKIT